MLPPDESAPIIDLAAPGADAPAFRADVNPIIEKRCLICHDGSNPHIPNLTGFDNVKKVTEATPARRSTLVRVSHIHLFGMTFIFFIMGLIFSHAYVRPVWFKCAVIATPFAGHRDGHQLLVSDQAVPSVWLGRDRRRRADGGCFAFMWLVTMYQLWFSKPPTPVLERAGGDVDTV